MGSLSCLAFVEGAKRARATDGGRRNRARRGQRATANTAAGDYVACRRGTVSSYPRRPPCSDWPSSLPCKRILLSFSLFLLLSFPRFFSSLLSSHPGPDSPSRFFHSRSPIFFFYRSRCPRTLPRCRSLLVVRSLSVSPNRSFFCFLSVLFTLAPFRRRRHGRFRFREARNPRMMAPFRWIPSVGRAKETKDIYWEGFRHVFFLLAGDLERTCSALYTGFYDISGGSKSFLMDY